MPDPAFEATSSPRRALLLGGGGLLGAALQRLLPPAGIVVVAPPRAEADLRRIEALNAAVDEVTPDLLINAAALSKVDRAELEPQLAYAINAVGAHNAALAAARAGIPLVQISTDYVFDGQLGQPYPEHSPTGWPPNVYGRSKLEGEQLVRGVWPRHFILRVAALFGAGGRPDFIDWVLQHADPAAPLTIVDDRFTSPTWTDDVARQLLPLVRTPYFGTYHACGRGVASFYELARAALLLAGRDPAGVRPIPDAQFTAPARRARFTALENHLLGLRGLERMQPWRAALAAHLGAATDTAAGPAAPAR